MAHTSEHVSDTRGTAAALCVSLYVPLYVSLYVSLYVPLYVASAGRTAREHVSKSGGIRYTICIIYLPTYLHKTNKHTYTLIYMHACTHAYIHTTYAGRTTREHVSDAGSTAAAQ
jgi:hypothetical protein